MREREGEIVRVRVRERERERGGDRVNIESVTSKRKRNTSGRYTPNTQ